MGIKTFDSVINGGPFDGVAGLVTAIEILRIFKENNIENYCPIEIVVMNDEEGVRFGTAVSNSCAMAGFITEEELDNLKDRDGISLRHAMRDFGINSNLESAKRPENSIKTFIELHIEQGPVLEYHKKEIGLVERIVGFDNYKVYINGNSGHAGTTPMEIRKDALVAASDFIIAVNDIAKEIGGCTVGTVGEIKITPNALNVIPGFVELSIDVRSTNIGDLDRAQEKLSDKVDFIENNRCVNIELSKIIRIDPVELSKDLINIMEKLLMKGAIIKYRT